MSDIPVFDTPEVFCLATNMLAKYTDALQALVQDMVDAGLGRVISEETLFLIDEAKGALQAFEEEVKPALIESLKTQKHDS